MASQRCWEPGIKPITLRRAAGTIDGRALSQVRSQERRYLFDCVSRCLSVIAPDSALSRWRTGVVEVGGDELGTALGIVEMGSAFTPCRASDSKSCVATPACERIPTPTTASFATLSSALSFAPGNSAVMFRA